MTSELSNSQNAPAHVPTYRNKKTVDKSSRTRAREFALQGLYQFLVSKNPASDIDLFTRELIGFHKADSAYYDALLHGCIENALNIDESLKDFLDRPLIELSPIEHAVLWIGTYELQYCLDVPVRVVLNEGIELAKAFGGTDGHKYVNGILHRLSLKLRSLETQNTNKSSSHPRSNSV